MALVASVPSSAPFLTVLWDAFCCSLQIFPEIVNIPLHVAQDDPKITMQSEVTPNTSSFTLLGWSPWAPCKAGGLPTELYAQRTKFYNSSERASYDWVLACLSIRCCCFVRFFPFLFSDLSLQEFRRDTCHVLCISGRNHVGRSEALSTSQKVQHRCFAINGFSGRSSESWFLLLLFLLLLLLFFCFSVTGFHFHSLQPYALVSLLSPVLPSFARHRWRQIPRHPGPSQYHPVNSPWVIVLTC